LAITLIKRLTTGVTPILLLSLVLLLSLYLLSIATEASADFDRLFSILIIVNVIGAVILVTMISANLYRLIKHYRQGVSGSRITVRLVSAFIISAVVPVCVVYYFSIGFLHRGIDSWFDVKVEQALQDALDLSRTSLDGRMRDLLRQVENISEQLSDAEGSLALMLSDFRESSGATELTILTPGRVVATSSEDPAVLIPNRPDEAVFNSVRQSGHYVGLDPISDQSFVIRIVVPLPSTDALAEARYLQALFPVAVHQSALAQNVQQGFAHYRELLYLRQPLKYSFTLTLSLVLLLTMLASVWAALFSARRLAAPIRDLAEGTRAVAQGDYSLRLPTPLADDELGFLVKSFNEMTEKVAQARDQVERSQLQSEAQRAYLQTVLAHLSSGVLSFDNEMVLRTANRVARDILGAELQECIGQSTSEIRKYPAFTDFINALEPQFSRQVSEWGEELTLFGPGGRKVLMCRGAGLPDDGGYVVVFDDITHLIQAQRDAAWGEVARRLAHEIKNPLTPIQLSAERLRHKYLRKLDKADAEDLDRYTSTIVHHVDQMKEMVNAFSQYARTPKMDRQPMQLNRIVAEVVELYRTNQSGVSVETVLDDSLPEINADTNQLRQVLHNLIKNAVEALDTMDNGHVTITTRCDVLAECRFVELRVSDNGPGIASDILNSMFEPYVTTKTRGTGLGLAIVKKIIEEHGGMLLAENLDHGGAVFVITLPVEQKDR
jgi:nitrogen fixation/metabolism regulation signal transduction histidine kinase